MLLAPRPLSSAASLLSAKSTSRPGGCVYVCPFHRIVRIRCQPCPIVALVGSLLLICPIHPISLVARFVADLYTTFQELHFTYLEINPLGQLGQEREKKKKRLR